MPAPELSEISEGAENRHRATGKTNQQQDDAD